MIRLPGRILSIALLLLASAPALFAADIIVDSPRVLLTGVPAGISVDTAGTDGIGLTLDGRALPSRVESDDLTTAVLAEDATGVVRLEVTRHDQLLHSQEIHVVPGWVSVLPPLVAILLSFLLRSVIPSLFAGLILGAWMINGMTWQGAVTGVFDTMTIYILNAMIDRDHGAIILFTLLIGGMVGIVSRNGGMVGIVNRVLPIARTPKRGQTVIACLGLGIFFDDYANTLIVGNAARPVSDHLKISREKLAYLVDSTAAPVATVAVITTWIGFQVGLIEDAMAGLTGIDQPAYSLFLQSIPYSFYPFLAVFFVFLIVLSGKDFGPMYRAERRARSSGRVTRDAALQSTDQSSGEFGHEPGIPCRARNAVLPIVCLVAGVIGGMYISGEGDSLQEIVGSADAYVVLIWASLLSCMVAFFLSLGQGILRLEECVQAWIAGAQFMLAGLLLLVMAWAIADVTRVLQTAPYLISILGDTLSPYTLPTIVFLLAAGAGFAAGSSWGVMAILMPLVIPLCWAVLQSNGIADAAHMHILYSCIACVLCGAVWSDHCSPISDTTVLSSLATGCDHMDHVTTQLPYALLGGTVAVVICTLPAGYGLPWWMLLATGAVVLYVAHRFLGKATDPPGAGLS
ncbi:Na+/H+ antiporter NhaC family protein [Parahaliea maris]|uniref:Na+/H+ antiporter NhaC family protein n=1 Tax=Parahaliea maris TaxID=2716870 RepID=A0A5C9A2P5_9GAMM|nr:Na+/H+ antiporter NhaC family protein [Parahaliea maris]TXS94274.1 Na+/H+ antiporter NhaC family protein [Parahaliea maris]